MSFNSKTSCSHYHNIVITLIRNSNILKRSAPIMFQDSLPYNIQITTSSNPVSKQVALPTWQLACLTE